MPKLLTALVLVLVGWLAACSTPTSPTATPPATSTATSTPAAAVGYLEGKATIGPLTPVERLGVPTPTPSPEQCLAWGLNIYREDGSTQVVSLNLEADCTYLVALPPGAYVVKLKGAQGVGGSNLPQTVVVEGGQTRRLDISIDTGIR